MTVYEDINKPWRRWATIIVGGILAFGCLTGFIVMPVIQGMQAGVDPSTAILRSLGMAPGSPAAQQPVARSDASPVSQVAWTPSILRRLSRPNLASGQEIAAANCASCHGEQGLSTDPTQFPNMAGQSPIAIYKQLHDYKTGARRSEVMQGVVANLSDEQMADVSSYFAGLQQPRWDPTWVQTAEPRADMLARTGDSARGLAACESCHSDRSGGPIETPVLFAQTKEYLAAQMNAFRSGERSNDVYQRMRSIAAKLTDEEIDQLAQYYTERR